ncbi:polysaccharide deacetylase family protein [Cohnella panacarvi]|uniref:polysaccharide deacetylase family protein n=1 Tax=Cohnella panacarvi TaxID=400776 RepID=UPI00047B9F42|nr:polysaccharide deacetylase family protein [Cohnella panacarvi]
MNATKMRTKAFAMAICLLLVVLLGTYGPLHDYLTALKQTAAGEAFSPTTSNAELLQWIKQEASARTVPAINAVNDRVWKAIPGYNGKEVDIEATYRKAVEKGIRLPGDAETVPWIYREVKPKVNLSDLPLLPIYRGNPAKPMVALMINVAWGDEYIMPMLDTLKAANVHATFFLDGMWLSKHKEVAKEIIARGHEVSNHAYSHPNMSRLGPARQREEIGKVEKLLDELGVDNHWFAPPSGDYNGLTVQTASEYGLRTVLWTLDTLDWMKPASWTIVSKVKERVGPGTLILMHPTEASKGALSNMITTIKAKGYSLGTVSETLSTDRA